MAKEESQSLQDVPGVTRPYTLLEAVAEVRRRYTVDGKVDPISANPAELPGGGIVFWDTETNSAVIKPYDSRARLTPTTNVITTGNGGSPEIILPPMKRTQ